MLSTKDRILDAVISYIQEHPTLNQLSVSKIAQRAGLGKSTVYDYFDTKDALLEEAYLYLLDKYKTILLRDIPLTTYKESLMALLKNILEVIKDAKLIMDSIFNIDRGIEMFKSQKCTKHINVIQQELKKTFEDIALIGVKNGDIESQTNAYIPHIIQSLISGLMLQFVNGKIDISEDDLVMLIYQEITRVLSS